MKKVLFLIVSIVILGLVFAGCNVTKITAPDSSESLERVFVGPITWTGQGSDSMNCDPELFDENRTEDGWIHWVLTQSKNVTDAEIVLGGSGSGTYPRYKLTGGASHFFTPYFDVATLEAVVNYDGELGDNPQFVISDYCPGIEPCVIDFMGEGNAYIGFEDWPNGDFDYNDFGMYFNAQEYYEGECGGVMYLNRVVMTFEANIYDSGGDHLIHIFRPIVGDSNVTVTRGDSVAAEQPAGTFSLTADLNIVLFDTSKYPWPSKNIGEIVTVEIELLNPELNPYVAPTAPRWDVPDFMGNYDPYAVNNSSPFPGFFGTEWHIAAFQTVGSVSPNGDPALVGMTLPHMLVIPSTNWVPPAEGTCITGPYGHFYDFYSSNGVSYPDWFEIVTGPGLSW